MSFTTYATAVAGTILTAAFWNQQVRDNGNVLKVSIADDGRISGDLKNFFETQQALAITSNVLTVNLSNGNNVAFALTANITTTTLQNIPASGKFATLNFKVSYSSASVFTWAWLTATVKWPGGVAPVFTLVSGKVDNFLTWTDDGGTTWRGIVVGQNL